MRISYDQEVDAIYIRLVDGEQECRTLRLSGEVALNIGPNEQLVGIEILNARQVVGGGAMPDIIVENLPLNSKASPGVLVVHEKQISYGKSDKTH